MAETMAKYFRPGFSSRTRFSVTEDMVDKFAMLTGDRSALHVSEAFARRSIYRQPVVHGMLPVAFLPLLEGLKIDGLVCRPVTISGRFVAPVYIGDVLDFVIELSKEQSSDREVTFAYHIEKTATRAIVTEGRMTALYQEAQLGRVSVGACEREMAALVLDPPETRSLSLEEISKGDSDSFRFVITEGAVRSFEAILAAGAQSAMINRQATVCDGVYVENVMALVLFSTLVGMRLPGTSATFLEFSATIIEGEIQSGTLYRLEGKVVHVSRATNITKIEISISRDDDDQRKAFIVGKVSTLVNRPARMMPTMKELQISAVDLGLKNKVVLITGASRGIGETTAKLFALFGARVVINYYRGKGDADRIVQEIHDEGGAAIAVQADITQSDQVRRMAEKGIERFGAIDILVNNAVRDFRPISFESLTWDEIQKDLDVIVKGHFFCCKEVIPLMLKQRGGKIINISSIAVDDPPPDQMKYVLSKSALVGLTRSLSMELASKNIQVNMVVPNFVETDLVSHVHESFRTKIAQDMPMKRHASPVDVAHAVLFLASSFSSYTTGQKIMVTGGKPPYL